MSRNESGTVLLWSLVGLAAYLLLRPKSVNASVTLGPLSIDDSQQIIVNPLGGGQSIITYSQINATQPNIGDSFVWNGGTWTMSQDPTTAALSITQTS
jgi:hypothetical protein